MKIESKINHDIDYGCQRNLNDIKYIVIQSVCEVPTHYGVIGDKAVQYIPDIYISESINGAKLSHLGIYHGICTRYNSITISITSDSEKSICLIRTLMQRYKIPPENVLRKMDVTGEANPEIWFDKHKWNEIQKKLSYVKSDN